MPWPMFFRTQQLQQHQAHRYCLALLPSRHCRCHERRYVRSRSVELCGCHIHTCALVIVQEETCRRPCENDPRLNARPPVATMASKRKASAMNAAGAGAEEPVDPSDELMFLCLGGGNEVGRSCHIIQYKGKTVMVNSLLSHCYTAKLTSFSPTARRWATPCVRRSCSPPILRRFRSQHRRCASH